MKKATVNIEHIRIMFEKETGISKTEIEEISEAFPVSLTAHIHTMDRTFNFRLNWNGLPVKGSFIEEK